jgi:hypothetical protein
MAEKNSVYVQNSRYVSGGTTEVNKTALEWWERKVFPVNSDDTVYVIEKRFEGRLDLISAVFLGEPRYWWVIAQYNNVLDPHSEITEGAIIYIPTLSRVMNTFIGKVGGEVSTRAVPTTIFPIV